MPSLELKTVTVNIFNLIEEKFYSKAILITADILEYWVNLEAFSVLYKKSKQIITLSLQKCQGPTFNNFKF